MTPYNNLFRPGPNSSLNVCVGANGGPYEFDAYAEGFFEAGNAIIHAAKSSRSILDLSLYPAAYNYRHGTELFIKHFIRGIELYKNSGTIKAHGHDLVSLFDQFVNLSASLPPQTFNSLHISLARDIILELDELDKNGETFRYPEDKTRTKHLKDHEVINLEILEDGMRVLFNLLEEFSCIIDALNHPESA